MNILYSAVHGVGKNLFEAVLQEMIGPENCETINDAENQLLGQYNNFLEKIFLVLDESPICKPDKIKKLQNLITCPKVSIRKMCTDSFVIANFTRFLMCTNEDQSVLINAQNRRISISTCHNGRLAHEDAIELVEISRNKKVLRLIYEDLLAVPMTENFDFVADRIITDQCRSVQEQGRKLALRFFIDWYPQHAAKNKFKVDPYSLFQQFLTYCTNANFKHTHNKDKFARELCESLGCLRYTTPGIGVATKGLYFYKDREVGEFKERYIWCFYGSNVIPYVKANHNETIVPVDAPSAICAHPQPNFSL